MIQKCVTIRGKKGVFENSKKEWVYLSSSNNVIKSFVKNIAITDCFLKAISSDQMGVLFNVNDNAKYGSSFVSFPWGESLLACDKNVVYSDSGIILISLVSKENNSMNSTSVSPENFFIFSLSMRNSSNTNAGEISSQSTSSSSSIMYFLTESDLKNENNIFASTINFDGRSMIYNPCRFATLRFSSSANLSACFSVSRDLEAMLSATSNRVLLINRFKTLANATSNSAFNSSGTSNLIDISAIQKANKINYLRFSTEDFSLQSIIDIIEDFNSGSDVYLLDLDTDFVFITEMYIEKVPYSEEMYTVDKKTTDNNHE